MELLTLDGRGDYFQVWFPVMAEGDGLWLAAGRPHDVMNGSRRRQRL